MIEQNKYLNALHALWAILNEAEQVATDHRDYKLAKILDLAVKMPFLIGSKQDRTEEFRSAVEQLIRDYPECEYILGIFDGRPPEWL